jgi:predicted acylesterase/phospholipase RssA
MKKSALVVSGSGASVIVAAGMLKGLANLNIGFEYVIGSSSGAMLTAFYAANQLDWFYNFCLKIMDHNLFRLDILNIFTRQISILSNKPAVKTLNQNLDFEALRRCPTPCVVTATDLVDWSTVYTDLTKQANNDDIVDAVVTSAAIPLLFPFKNNLIDGGTIDDYPVLDALGLDGIDRVYWLVPVFPEVGVPTNPIQMGTTLINLLLGAQSIQVQRAINLFHPNVQVVLIQPTAPTGVGLLNFSALGDIHQRQQFLNLGYTLAQDAVSKVGGP